MTEALQFLLVPFVMCLLLVGIHCYLGLHVLARGVVFVDLSLAQVASLGSTFALLIDPEGNTTIRYGVSLLATLFAAGLFTLARRHEKLISQEALIGVTYAFASATVVLIADKLPHGAEHLKEALIGQILWVQWPEVSKTFLIYLFIGFIHWVFREKFIQTSFQGRSLHWIWDFLFYALFGVVITSSTPVAGVLVVFSFLIVPAVLSTFFFSTLKARLLFGWTAGALVSFVGMVLSYKFDLPVGATLVVLLTILPLVSVGILSISRSR